MHRILLKINLVIYSAYDSKTAVCALFTYSFRTFSEAKKYSLKYAKSGDGKRFFHITGPNIDVWFTSALKKEIWQANRKCVLIETYCPTVGLEDVTERSDILRLQNKLEKLILWLELAREENRKLKELFQGVTEELERVTEEKKSLPCVGSNVSAEEMRQHLKRAQIKVENSYDGTATPWGGRRY